MKTFAAVAFVRRAFTPVLVDRFALAIVLILALLVRFYAISVPAIWNDEAYSLLLARETPERIWALTARDVHPPLYYMLLHYWVSVWGDSALSARALSALADLGTLLLCIKLMSLISTRRATWIAALLLALLPISVRYSQEVRMYSLLGCWLMAATVALVCWARVAEQGRFAVIYVLLMSAAFYTHYFAGLCVLVHWLFWWLSRNNRPGMAITLGQWLLANLTIVVLYLPWVPHLIAQLANTTGLGWIKPVTLQEALSLVWQFTLMGNGAFQASAWHLLPLALLLFCATTVIADYSLKQPFRFLPIGYFFVPLTTLYVFALFLPLFVPRYLVFSAPAIAMIAALALDGIWRRRALLATVGLLLFVVVQLNGLTAVYRQTDGLNGTNYRRDTEFGQLVKRLNQNALPGDEVIIANPFWYPTFTYYDTTGIDPRFEVRSSIDDYLKLTSRGLLSLIKDPVASMYIDGITVLDCRSQRVWWITDADLHADRPQFAKDRTPVLTIHGGNISAYLFTADSVPASAQASTYCTLKPRPLPAAQNCPPAPSATSANRTRHSLPR
jgi:4-amino-4-deoxy-L-arabinose transferase-like glycosyltransferase